MKKALPIFLAVLLTVSLLAGCSGTKEFTYQELTMDVPFGMIDVSGDENVAAYSFALDSRKTAVFGLREEKALFADAGITSLDQYAELLLSVNELDTLVVDRSNYPYKYLRYEKQLDDGIYKYLTAVFESEDAYWMIQYAARITDYDETAYFKYLDTVRFS